jgi:hypothetical protein
MITLGPELFDKNNRLITLSGGYKHLHYLTQFIVTTFYMYKKQQNLHLVVPDWIADTHNAFGSLLLYVAHHDKEFVELLASGHWLEELLKLLLLYLYN